MLPTVRRAQFYRDVLAFDMTRFPHPLAERGNVPA
jgi:hypothetical protein